MGFFHSELKTWLLKRKRKNAGVSARNPNAEDNETSDSSISEPKSHKQEMHSQLFKTWLLKRKRKNADVSEREPSIDNETGGSSNSKQGSNEQEKLDIQPGARIQHSSRLLTLPPEIRNSIYEYALHEAGKLVVTIGLQQPPLLTACRQTRQETLTLWYTRTTFEVVVVDCNNSLLKTFGYHLGYIWNRYFGPRDPFHLVVACIGSKNWGNLIDWCYDVFDRCCASFVVFSVWDQMLVIVSAAHSIVRNARGYSSWEDVKAQLEVVRVLAGKLDEEWSK
ncbi:hypothetical protein LTR37_010306 [Vermiconidia calcicola]|uniref:Uncharacterized protein n=1 Tax=Vermiconidia calcicola TaxID=1690605 RepID=A0ACC3N6L9_9PEZI|nr:hypothetical protein LTR37_010306 [Vermiconidia calcicola]